MPTPLTRHREPDLSFVETTARAIALHLRPGQLSCWNRRPIPARRRLLRPILESGGLRSGTDFYLAYSPEREDPGNPHFGTSTIPKVVGGDGEAALALAELSQPVRRQDRSRLIDRDGRSRETHREHFPGREHRPRERIEVVYDARASTSGR